jgi:hypothetical protein
MENYKEDIQHIRKMMERSSQFLSLSGLSGIGAGIVALLCISMVFYIFEKHQIDYFDGNPNYYSRAVIIKLMGVALITILLAVFVALHFTVKKLKKSNIPLYNASTKKFLISLGLPLVAGGIFCIALTYNLQFYMVAPSMLIFYGLSLVNASKYTQEEIYWLGVLEIVIGLFAAFFVGYGLIFWAVGFGFLHILYGIIIHRKYN